MSFKLNVKANLGALQGEGKFQDIPADDTILFRFAPPVDDDGLIFYKTFNHYKFKDADGNAIALADLRSHGTAETGYEDYIAKLSEVLLQQDADVLKKIGKDIKGNSRYYAQGWSALPLGEGKYKYHGRRKFMALPKTAAEAIMQIAQNQEKMGEPVFCDSKKGQLILISRTGSGLKTRYSAERSGIQSDLDELIPDWKEQLAPDLYAELGLNVLKPSEQRAIAMNTYPDLPWDDLDKLVNVNDPTLKKDKK